MNTILAPISEVHAVRSITGDPLTVQDLTATHVLVGEDIVLRVYDDELDVHMYLVIPSPRVLLDEGLAYEPNILLQDGSTVTGVLDDGRGAWVREHLASFFGAPYQTGNVHDD